MRALIVLGLAAGLLALGGNPSQARYEGPWCMKANAGFGHIIERCHFASFNACNHERAMWGSSAFCVQSHRYLPNWGYGAEQPRRAAKRKTSRQR